MTSEEWEILQRAFDEAVTLDEDARETLLREFEREHPKLADNLRRMLDEDGTGDHKLLAPIAEAAADLTADSQDPWIGRTLGPYEIVARIAVGGMGAVFRARRADQQFDQQVAIKIMSAQLLADDAILRFKTERQILANLNHPNIGKLLDGGTTDGGLPYLVMEFIDGEPIDEYCDRHKLDITHRLRLFQEVCEGVDYAHRNLVVHRDLKPSNIIITHEGKAQLVDFGIAKLLDSDAVSQPLAETREGARAMTRAFASPEQVRGEPVSVATDVYSLGVLLYQLLTGHSPYGSSVSTPKDVENAILETDPKRPSTMVTSLETSEVSPSDIGDKRSSSPARLKNRLSGDLDNIVLMAMRKEPEHRYSSVLQFADDIERYLQDEPVRAHPVSWRYRTSKFVKRNKLGVLVVAASVLVITVMTSVYTVNVTRERNRAQLEANTAERVSEFMQSLFETADPYESQGESLSVRSILDAGARRIDYELAEEPALRAAMLDAMGGAYEGLGLYRESKEMLTEALDMRRELFGDNHADVLETLVKLASLENDSGAFTEAEEISREALQLSRSIHGEYHPTTGVCLHLLGWSLFEQGRIDEALPWFELGIKSFEQSEPDGGIDRASFLNAYGWVLLSIGEYEGAERTMREALAMSEQILGESHPMNAVILGQLTYVLADTGRWQESEQTIRRAVDINGKALGQEHRFYSLDLAALAWVLESTGRPVEAEALYRQSLDIDLKILGPKNRAIAIDQNNLAGALRTQGRYREAADLYRESMLLNRELMGPQHPETATSTANLANALIVLAEFDEAAELSETAYRVRLDLYGEDHMSTILSREGYARLLHERGDLAESRPVYEAVVEGRRQILGPDHPTIGWSLTSYAALLRDSGEPDAAEQAVMDALTLVRAAFDEAHQSTVRSKYTLATILAAKPPTDEVEQLFLDAIAARREQGLEQDPILAERLVGFAQYRLGHERPDDAMPLLQEALQIQRAVLADHHWQIGVSESLLGQCRRDLGIDGAEELLTAGHVRLVNSLGDDHFRTVRAAARLQ